MAAHSPSTRPDRKREAEAVGEVMAAAVAVVVTVEEVEADAAMTKAVIATEHL